MLLALPGLGRPRRRDVVAIGAELLGGSAGPGPGGGRWRWPAEGRGVAVQRQPVVRLQGAGPKAGRRGGGGEAPAEPADAQARGAPRGDPGGGGAPSGRDAGGAAGVAARGAPGTGERRADVEHPRPARAYAQKKSGRAAEQDRADVAEKRWPCREFRVWAGMMGAKEPRHAATQRADDP